MEAPSHLEFGEHLETKTKATLLAYVLQSVLYWALLVVTVCTVLAFVIPYLTR